MFDITMEKVGTFMKNVGGRTGILALDVIIMQHVRDMMVKNGKMEGSGVMVYSNGLFFKVCGFVDIMKDMENLL
jgi:hypothetical protein